MPSLPAAATKSEFAASAWAIASRNACEYAPPLQELFVTDAPLAFA
jgi:hypothetical protein